MQADEGDPWWRMSGTAAARSARAGSRIVWVRAVAWSTVCDRVAPLKSSKRSRSVTVRPTRRAFRLRDGDGARDASVRGSANRLRRGGGPREWQSREIGFH